MKAGSVIPCTLVTGINSDPQGQITCHTRQNVFNAVTGYYLLIPQGTGTIGPYDSVMAFEQELVLAVWHRLVMPNGNAIDLESVRGVDLSRCAG